ncbi:class III lanthionine synthetase LanKC [Fulvivirga sediminis]|uniref:Class III lanthionine synthetase LanKC n=1 Tax=Fulvivirga sediminis TaxID=2803949 RepID=A0A937FBC1_9BACT|nr:class III lanthionine synthetase LanKC [Fulvivirga sediminis]MBL3659090.1 class III lanthionine synthetase LanKC [Fulvivirga sediminis]
MDRAADIAVQNLFAIVHPEYYEPLSRYRAAPNFLNKLKELVPQQQWKIIRNDVWLHVQCHEHLPHLSDIEYDVQGFKIHLSCGADNAIAILDNVVPLLIKNKINFKIACDQNILDQLNSKGQPRGHAGKFMTIYPKHLKEFTESIEQLYQATNDKKFVGPYILSDRRYKDSKIIHYRYGGFKPIGKLTIYGTKMYYMLSPEGEYVPDERLPYFNLPSWVEDPFDRPVSSGDGEGTLLHDRYVVEGVFGFSNAGGVYHGKDTLTGQEIVIKEARPYTNYWQVDHEQWDAVHLLKREYAILDHLKELPFIPEPVELFQEWEHTFLVEKRIDVMGLDEFWASDDNIFAPYVRRAEVIAGFAAKFKKIAISIINMVKSIHEKGVLLGDISPRNILINKDTLECWLIDFESAVFTHDSEQILKYAAEWGTEGYIKKGRKDRGKVTAKDDFYAVAMTLYNAIIPANNMFKLNPGARDRLLHEFVQLGLPVEIKQILDALMKGDENEALQLLTSWLNPVGYPSTTALKTEDIQSQLVDAVDKMINYIRVTADYDRTERLWPAHYVIFSTNPLNISYGACGTALFVLEATKTLPQKAADWMLSKKLDHGNYPPGLFTGMAGIAYTFDQMGYRERAEELMDMVFSSSMLLDEACIFNGSAGCGLVSLYFYTKTENYRYLEEAIIIGNHLIDIAQKKDDACFWPSNTDNTTHYGYGYGASGIGLYLLYLYVATQQTKFLDTALRAIEFDLAQQVESEVGVQWKRFKDDVLLYPYFIHGAAGIGSVLIRFYHILKDDRFKKLALKIAEDSYIKYSFIPGQFEGMAGIGELMIDIYHYTGDERFRTYGLDMAESIMWFGIEKPEGMAFPGRWLTRICHDYATGSAGIGLFFLRLLNNTERHFLDLDVKQLTALQKTYANMTV